MNALNFDNKGGDIFVVILQGCYERLEVDWAFEGKYSLVQNRQMGLSA